MRKPDYYDRYLEYIERARPTTSQFDEDWAPVGPGVRLELEAQGRIQTAGGRIRIIRSHSV